MSEELKELEQMVEECMKVTDELLRFYQSETNFVQNKDPAICLQLTQLARARKEFDSKLFFVVIYGPVKSGKSTLTNAFARQYVSPSRFGLECTCRPSILIQSDESAIYEYYPNEQEVDEKKYFDFVIDYLRGIITQEELKKYINIEKQALTRAAVEKKLTVNLERKPLVTVLTVPGGEFIQPGIAIIDMPGLDGQNINVSESPMYQWFLEKTDFLIFVQSSMAAINFETAKFLQTLVNESKNPPTWLVQNMIDARYWRSWEERKQEAEQQLMVTKQELIKLINPPDKDIDATAINIGKAYDGIQYQKQELVNDSGFIEFEQKLSKLLESKRIRITEKNSLTAMLGAVNRILHSLSNLRKEIALNKKKLEVLTQRMEQLLLIPNEISYSTVEVQKYKSNLKVNVNNIKNELLQNIEVGIQNLRTQVNHQLSGRQLNAMVSDFLRDSINHANTSFFNHRSKFGADFCSEINQSFLAMEETYLSRMRKQIEEFNALLVEYGEELSPLQVDVGALLHLQCTELTTVFPNGAYDGKFRVKERLLGIERHYDGMANCELIDQIHQDMKYSVPRTIDTWFDKTVSDIYSRQCENRRKGYRDLLQEQKQIKVDEWAKLSTYHQELQARVEQMEEQMSHLQKLLTTTIRKYTL